MQSTGRGREVTVTNDGATILKSLHIDNPAAKVLVGILIIFYCSGESSIEIIGWYMILERANIKCLFMFSKAVKLEAIIFNSRKIYIFSDSKMKINSRQKH